MKTLAALLSLCAALALSACAGQPRCNADADYRKAAAIPPIQAAPGLTLPASPSALKVPEITPEAMSAARGQPMPTKGRGTACLDYPPSLMDAPATAPAASATPRS